MSEDFERAILREIDALCPVDEQMLSAREQRILTLYNEQEEIRLEMALLEAQDASRFGRKFVIFTNFEAVANDHVSNVELQEHLQMAEREVTEARASYMLRNKIIQDVLITDPVLKAVHAGSHATRAERY